MACLFRRKKIDLEIGLMIFIFLSGCSSDDVLSLPDEPSESPVIGVYEEENRWIYEQMNHYYLWREDLPDSLSCNYITDPVTFYKALLSARDRFSYCSRNTNYNPSTKTLDYGFAYQEYKSSLEGTLLQVLYVTSSRLKNLGLRRGDWVRRIGEKEGVTLFERGTVESGIFSSLDTLAVEQSMSGEQSSSVYLDSIYQVKNSKVGYLCYLEFDAVTDLEPSFKKFYEQQIDELILDLRYNPGGYVSTCRYLCNSIVPEQGYGKIFQQCSYNDRLSQELQEETGSSMTREYYETPVNDEGAILGCRTYGLNLLRVYVLTSQYTASASEATILCLRPYMDVRVIGEQTYGKGVGSWTIRDSRYKYMLQPITMRYYNAEMETTPDEGLDADIGVGGGYYTVKKDLGDLSEPLLSVALQCIMGNDSDLPMPIVGQNATRADCAGLVPIGVPSFFNCVKPEY